jgi:preprotein translocase subunit SecY
VKPFTPLIPEVQVPETKVPFQQRIVWTAVTLVIFLVMSQMPLYGIVSSGQPAPLEQKEGMSTHINNEQTPPTLCTGSE